MPTQILYVPYHHFKMEALRTNYKNVPAVEASGDGLANVCDMLGAALLIALAENDVINHGVDWFQAAILGMLDVTCCCSLRASQRIPVSTSGRDTARQISIFTLKRLTASAQQHTNNGLEPIQRVKQRPPPIHPGSRQPNAALAEAESGALKAALIDYREYRKRLVQRIAAILDSFLHHMPG